MSTMIIKPKKTTKAEILELERAERQAYYRDIERRLNATMRPVVAAISASRSKPKKS